MPTLILDDQIARAASTVGVPGSPPGKAAWLDVYNPLSAPAADAGAP